MTVALAASSTWVYATFIGHSDYSSGSSKVASYTLPPPSSIINGDWMYLVHFNVRDTADFDAALPAGWTNLVPTQRVGTTASGIEWSIWRKKYAGEANVTVTVSGTKFARATLICVRQPTDATPMVSSYVPVRAAANPSVISVPGAIANTTAISIAVNHQPSAAPFTQPPTISGPATAWFTAPGSNDNMFIAVAQGASPVVNTSNVGFSWPQGDAGQVGGVTLSFLRKNTETVGPPPILYPWPPESDIFHCTTDEYYDGVITLYGGTLPPGTATIWRINPDDSYFVIRGGENFSVTGDFQRSDTEALFDIENRYILGYTPADRALFHNWFKNPSFENGSTTWVTGTNRTISVKTYGTPDTTGRAHYADVSGYTGAPIFAITDRRYDLIHDRVYITSSPATLAQRILLYTKPDSGIVWTAGKTYTLSGRVMIRPSLYDWSQVRSDPATTDPIGTMTAPPARTWSDPFFGGAVSTVTRTNLAINPRAVDTGATSGWAPNSLWGSGGAGTMSYATIADGPVDTGITTVRRKQWTTSSTPSGVNTGMRIVGTMNGTTEEYFLTQVNDIRTVSLYVRHTSTQNKDLTVEVNTYDGINSVTATTLLASYTSTVATVPGGEWFRLSVEFTAPQGATGFAVNLRVGSATDRWNYGERLEATGMMIEAGTAVEDYFDGATDAATTRWQGVANASISEMFTSSSMSKTWADILGLPSGDTTQGTLYMGLTNSSGAALTNSPFIKVLDIAPPGTPYYTDFEVTFTLPATVPIGDVNIAFYQGDGTRTVVDPDTGQIMVITDPEEFSRIWSFDALMLDYANDYYAMDYFDGATPMPTRTGIGYDTTPLSSSFAWDSGDATISWTGTADNSASVFIGASTLGAYASGCILHSRTAINGYNICEPVFLSDPIVPEYSQWLGLLNIGALAWDPRRDLIDILGRHPPVALSQYRSTPHAEFRFLTRTLDERLQFIKIINSGRVLLLRNPDPHYPETMWYVSIGSVSEERIDPDHRNPVRRWVCDLQVVDRPSGLIAALTGQSWQHVRDIHTDWQDVQTKNDDWLSVLLGSAISPISARAGVAELSGISSRKVVVPTTDTSTTAAIVGSWEPVP